MLYKIFRFWIHATVAKPELGTPEDPKKRVLGGKNSFTFLSKPQEPAIVFAMYLLNARAK